jgi:hypothetical protein
MRQIIPKGLDRVSTSFRRSALLNHTAQRTLRRTVYTVPEQSAVRSGVKGLVGWDDTVQEARGKRQRRDSGQQPRIAQFARLDVQTPTIHSADTSSAISGYEPRSLTHFLQQNITQSSDCLLVSYGC